MVKYITFDINITINVRPFTRLICTTLPQSFNILMANGDVCKKFTISPTLYNKIYFKILQVQKTSYKEPTTVVLTSRAFLNQPHRLIVPNFGLKMDGTGNTTMT